MQHTKGRWESNLAGLQFLSTRNDTKYITAESELLDQDNVPSFAVYRKIMRDNLTLVCIACRVGSRTFNGQGEQYTYWEIAGRGTTFEMALLDLSLELMRVVGPNDCIDTDDLQIVTRKELPSENTNKSLCSDKPDTAINCDPPAEQNESEGLDSRSDNTDRGGAKAKRNSGSKRKTGNRDSRGGDTERDGRRH